MLTLFRSLLPFSLSLCVNTLQPLGEYLYKTNTGEGWGLAYDGKHLVMSDGSDVISFFDLPTGESGTTMRRVGKLC
jgi:glutamine cyclotransferase